MRSFGWQVDFDSFTDTTPYGDKPFSNIIATLPVGSVFRNNKKPTQRQIHTTNRVIFACHYDSKYFANFDFIGATDSAVPCAMLLDMAKFIQGNFNLNQFNQVKAKNN
jgi:glutaminyl-peptide cyclotransferase